MEKRNEFYAMEAEDVKKFFGSTTDGLSDAQVERNREEFGANKLAEEKKKSIVEIFLSQFKDLLVFILIVAAAISFFTGSASSTIVILIVLILNATLGTIQYLKAEKSLESLKKLSSQKAKVIRDGSVSVIDAEDLVCGDIITLDAGDIVPADARIIESFSLKCNESSLTGESENTEKDSDIINLLDVALGDRKNIVFSGSLVTYGRATAVVCGVGESTELGKIASLMSSTKDRKTPLQVTMDNFSKKLSIIIIAISIVIFALSIYRGMEITSALLFAVALAVAAIPEALSSIITISLAIGTKKMAEQNAIIKDLNAVEGLGCVGIICSDKTGTLTQNKMSVEYEHANKSKDKLYLASILCNDTKIANTGDGKEYELTGDPTETAYVEYYISNFDIDTYKNQMAKYPRISEVPFDSDRKLMSTLHNIDGENVMFTKGAIDVILKRSINLSDDDIRKVKSENEKLSSQGLRVLGFATKRMDKSEIFFDDEKDLEYIGLLAEMDPPRKESAKAVQDCKMAGIKPIMITGDHKVTATAIAKKIGIFEDGDLSFTGPEIDKMSDEELNDKLEKISVYARVSPDNKIRIVNAWQNKGKIVAMTGDGVNDGPALKSADVGVAMGITGTEVAKDAASMILTDDNFATIIGAVLNGRNTYENIKNAIKYLLSGNAAAIVSVLYASLAALSMPFTAAELLFINLITDSLPALAISMEPSKKALIKEKPRKRDESILNHDTLKDIIVSGLLIAVTTMIAFHIGNGDYALIKDDNLSVSYGADLASTMAFATLCLARLFHGFNCRSKESIAKIGIFSNMYSIYAFVLGCVLLHVILLVPFFHEAFGISTMNVSMLVYVWILAFIPTLIIQLIKAIGQKK